MSRRSEDKKRFEDACGLAHAMDLIGERWAMLVLRELAYGPRRFSGLKRDLTGISANVLTQRLTELEARGLVRKSKLPPPASVQVYEATDWGLEAIPVIANLGRWAARSPLHDPTLPMSHVSIIMSMQTLISPERAAGVAMRVGFRLGDADYFTTVHDGRLDVERTEPAGCDLVFTGSPTAIAGVIHGGAPFDTIDIEGDLDLARRFIDLFVLPAKVEATPALA
ncbi:winged helix-turn-helix transcriptional regulator [Sphingomonas alba]|uniref:Helix-turn-helix transcriptional regulator n=1 Tax=Sphingomonas alba TaxID=2908208 RepID=A0ABT0RLV7_9SPHN|nr:helix-turn-helix domain-containing protein [Sphingomonas alba]MCL6683631.1 helix-turn-helix transcriptional regulator [Sphingomonas alba]